MNETQTIETQTNDTDNTILSNQIDDKTADTTKTTDKQTQDETILSTPVSPVKPDGSFIENWKDTLPKELRDEKCLDTVTDFNNAIKQLVSHKKMVGKDKVAVPTDKSKPEEWDAFYSAIGRPKTEADYAVPEIPEDIKDIFDEDRLKIAKKAAWDLGATQKQFNEYLKYEIGQVQAFLAEQDKLDIQARQDAEKELRKEFGAAYDERIHVSNRLIHEAFTNEEERMTFLEEFGNNPHFIRFASRVGSRMTEHTALIAELTKQTPTEIEARIAELRNTPGYMQLSSKMSKEERERITDEIRELTKQLHPVKKTG